MNFCLPVEFANKFIDALKKGDIDPNKLIPMSSEERRAFFGDIVGGENARDVNALFESKLLLKNQQAGLVTWAKQVGGLSEKTKADIVSTISKMDKALSAENEQAFYEDLAAKKLGTDVSFEEAQQITSFAKAATDAKTKIDPSEPLGSSNRMEYGAAKVQLENTVNDLKLKNQSSTLKETAQAFKTNPVKATAESISKIAGVAKGIKASLDNSALFRQGWKTLFTNPQIWVNNAVDSFANISKQLGKKGTDATVMDGIKAEIYSRPNSINGNYSRMKLDIGEFEEAYPSAIPEKIPLFGRLYKASETAYTGFLYKMRADIADKMVGIAEGQGLNVKDNFQAESIGKLVNSLTGRGSLGSLEKLGKQVNTVFFSPKLVKSQFDFLTLHSADKMTSFARMQAAKNLLKVTAGMATILGTAKLLSPGSVEFDPTSADWGKIKVGNTRFDVSGGMGSLVTLAARLVTMSSKSSVTGKVTPLNSGKYGAQTGLDVATDFAVNKLSPAFSVLVDIMRGRTFQGTPPTVTNEAKNLFMPLSISNAQELMNDPNAANLWLGEILDALGISTNTYSKKKK